VNRPSSDPPVRPFLLAEVLAFVRAARQLPGIERIALIGSLTTSKADPKDADVLVTVADETDLTELARLGRRLKGRAQTINHGADIFLADPSGTYLGRICHWKECRPGIRMSCDALHCGWRHYLHDDLEAVQLDEELIAAPPVELWPQRVVRANLPADVKQFLLAPLREEEKP
jgi:hypothetical protein